MAGKTRRQAIKTFILGGLAGASATAADIRLVRAATDAPGGRDALAGAAASTSTATATCTAAAAGKASGLLDSDALKIARNGVARDARMKQVASYVQEQPVFDPIAPCYLKTLSDILAGQEVSLARFINPREFGAIQRGTSHYDCGRDLTAAFESGARGFYLPRGIWRFTGDLKTPPGSNLRGDGGGEYTGESDFALAATILERQDVGRPWQSRPAAVLALGPSANVTHLQVRPANYARVTYDLANYPANTNNTPTGIRFELSSNARHCTAIGFPHAGFHLHATSTLERCYAYMCDRGFYTDHTTDGSLINCIGMFCHTAGADLVDNFWQVIGGRYEWNARYGVIMGAESLIVGAVFDRNGFAGVCMKSGNWGKTVTGNYFSRNGCAGNGSLGRWNFSTPSHQSYLRVPPGQSCHIQIDYQQGATIVGNRFRPGRDDANDGCDGPQFVYGSTTGSGSTPLEGITIQGNFGDRAGDSIVGYTKDYPGGGAIAGGKDTSLVSSLNLGVGFERGGVASALHCGDQTTSPKTTRVSVNVLRGTSGRVAVRAAGDGHAQLSDILFATDAGDAGYKTVVNNLIGNAVKSAVLAANSSDARYNKVDIVLSEPCFVSYSVFST
jgi:hypothetical protein